MCGTCGCGSKAEARIVNLQTGAERPLADDHHHHDHHGHDHDHEHTHDHVHGADGGHAHSDHGHHDHDHHHGHHHHDHAPAADASVVALEARILAKNEKLAARNRGWFEGREILALNLMSSPGAGKTTLLERTIRDLQQDRPIFVIEGDQATANDGERIRAAGAAAIQVNTGTGCHLEADMIARALEELRPDFGSLLLIENVGNLVCPALFDLGERAKVIILSVTEGEDKPLKYPHMFQAADLMIVNKMDLLPHVDFDVERAVENARMVNPDIEVLSVSARSGDGMDSWYDWLRRHHAGLQTGIRDAL
ncbi:MAG: hydrogenase nickel incorporation protein HypB [Pseudolabrys sp.]|jgi:hydrogenase nickel incorporation protein HypB